MALTMMKRDHEQTNSYRNRLSHPGESLRPQQWRREQAKLIRYKDVKGAIEMAAVDYTRKFGVKYNEGK